MYLNSGNIIQFGDLVLTLFHFIVIIIVSGDLAVFMILCSVYMEFMS